MFTSHKQISPPSLVLKLKISEVSQKWIPKAVELKRIPTHKKCKCKKFCSQTRLVGEIYSSDVIMHRSYSTRLTRSLSMTPSVSELTGFDCTPKSVSTALSLSTGFSDEFELAMIAFDRWSTTTILKIKRRSHCHWDQVWQRYSCDLWQMNRPNKCAARSEFLFCLLNLLLFLFSRFRRLRGYSSPLK